MPSKARESDQAEKLLAKINLHHVLGIGRLLNPAIFFFSMLQRREARKMGVENELLSSSVDVVIIWRVAARQIKNPLVFGLVGKQVWYVVESQGCDPAGTFGRVDGKRMDHQVRSAFDGKHSSNQLTDFASALAIMRNAAKSEVDVNVWCHGAAAPGLSKLFLG